MAAQYTFHFMKHCSLLAPSLEDDSEVRDHPLPLPVALYPGKALLWDVPAEEVENLHVCRQASPQAEPVQEQLDGVVSLSPMIPKDRSGLDQVPMLINPDPPLNDIPFPL